jgi:hypothetical protein
MGVRFEVTEVDIVLLGQALYSVKSFGLGLERVVDFNFAEQQRADDMYLHAFDLLQELSQHGIIGFYADTPWSYDIFDQSFSHILFISYAVHIFFFIKFVPVEVKLLVIFLLWGLMGKIRESISLEQVWNGGLRLSLLSCELVFVFFIFFVVFPS